MKVSLSWLKEYVPIEMEVSALADALTMTGLEVESVSDRYAYLNTVLVGRITEIAPHPHADKLTLCHVDIGERRISVVCGAPNVKKDMVVPVAMPGTLLPDGTLLEKSVIRGVPSEGMICSESELGLGSDKNGVMVLRQDLQAGNCLTKAMNISDMVLDISLTPNRADCLSIIGIAREVAAIQKTKLKYPNIQMPDTEGQISDFSSVTILSPDHCPRYAARLVMDITIEPSPFWLKDRLLSAGLKPINNIVDITNFVMMETGQPLHAFDFEHLEEHRIVVRTAAEGERFSTLDGKERILSADMLMICDGKKPVALAGVMGGLNSEIEASTKKVLIESAYFNPMSIRKTAKKMGMNTDASHRFERGVDPKGTVMALNRAADLMTRIGKGRLIGGIIDAHPKPFHEKKIVLNVKAANRLLGTEFSQHEMETVLKSIEFQVNRDGDAQLSVVPPSFRPDISRPEDLTEEIARLSGYDRIPITFPMMPAETRQFSRQVDLRSRIKGLITGLGFTEAVTYSFINKNSCDRLRLESDDPRRNLIEVLNPLTEDQNVMRTSLIPGMLETMYHNIARQVRNLKLFEIGKVFIGRGQDNLPEETEMLAGLVTGLRSDVSWHSKEISCDFYDIKGVVEGILAGLNVENVNFTRLADALCRYTKSGHTAQIVKAEGNKNAEDRGQNTEVLGLIGEIHPEVLNHFNLKQPAFIFELNVNRLNAIVPDTKKSSPIPKYPAAFRDTTLIIDKSIEAGNLLDSIMNLKEALVEDAFLFDVFEGGAVPQRKKSVSFRIVYRSHQETLEDQIVTQIHTTIADKLIREFNAALPA